MGKARDFIPALKYGHKIMPDDIAGMLGLPYVGSVFYIDPINGSDTNRGTSADGDAFKTLTKAYAAITTNKHDVIVIVPAGAGTGEPYATVETAAITWSKNLCHLIGNVAGTPLSSRARVSTATAGLSPFITISGQGNSFHNVQFYSAATTNYINVRVSNNRNFFENVHFAGLANETAGNNATGASLELYGAQENYFVNCTIGLDTITRTAANANLKISLGDDTVARNVFDCCIFPMLADADAPLFIKQGDSGGMDRWNLFRGCQFINCVSSTSTTQTDAISIHATPGGMLVLHDCMKIGATGWANNLTDVYLLGFSTNATILTNYMAGVNPAA
jgi:hypothetical protein